MSRRCLVLLLALVTNACADPKLESVDDFIRAVEQPQHSIEADHDTRSLTELMEEYRVPAVSIAVIRDFDIHWAKAYGVADTETGVEATVGTLFQAASISKPVVAMAVLRAAQDGLFSMDDDINSLLSSWAVPTSVYTAEQPVTPRGLTTHTAGFGDGFGFPGYFPDEPLPTIVQIIEGQHPSNVGPVRMNKMPMQAMSYSGGGVTIMQLALEDVTNTGFAEYVRGTVFEAIGMQSSTFEQPLTTVRDDVVARAHNRRGRAMRAKWKVYPELAAAGLWTTPTDLAKFVIEIQKSVHARSNRVLDRRTVQEMLNPVGIGDFAVGFEVKREGDGWYFFHTGSNWGFRNLLIGHKLRGYGLVVMTNADRGDELREIIRRRVANAYGWDGNG